MPRYRVPRFTIGPKTVEIILDVGRALNVSDHFDEVELHVRRRKCGDQKTYVFESYSICDSTAHFRIPEEFMTSEVDRGFYDADVVIDECVVTNIEIVKAPSRYVKNGKSVDSDCADTDWVEPPCEDEEDECNRCGNVGDLRDGCLDCGHVETIVAEPLSIDIDYLGEE